VPKLIAGKVPVWTHTNKHKDPNLPQLPADKVPKLQNGKGGQVKMKESWNMKSHCPVPGQMRRDLGYSIENKPYIEARAELGVEDENVDRAFMRGPYESDDCVFQTDEVEGFCFCANLESLRVEKGKVTEPFVDERSLAEGTTRGLRKELQKPVRCLTLTPHFKKAMKAHVTFH
jgi:hypothetical protein